MYICLFLHYLSFSAFCLESYTCISVCIVKCDVSRVCNNKKHGDSTLTQFVHGDNINTPVWVTQATFIEIWKYPFRRGCLIDYPNRGERVLLFVIYSDVFVIKSQPFCDCLLSPISNSFINRFPHTTIPQQTTLKVFCQNIENLHN